MTVEKKKRRRRKLRTKAQKRGRRSRDKGGRGEREAADLLRPLFPDVRRKAMQARGGSEGADLENTPGFHIEVGVGKVNPRAKYEQALRDAIEEFVSDPKDVTVIALTRADRSPWLVTMSAKAWMARERRVRELEARVSYLEGSRNRAVETATDLSRELIAERDGAK